MAAGMIKVIPQFVHKFGRRVCHKPTFAQVSKCHGWVYRTPSTPPKRDVIAGELAGGLIWFWIFYSFWKRPDMFLGHFPYPDPSKWTDEELGIPSSVEEIKAAMGEQA